MARTTHVKHAQQRYAMKPDIDPETGQQKEVAVLDRQGNPKTTKSGRPVVRKLTVRDTTKPLPAEVCGKCSISILPGQPYKWIEPQSRGRMVRCAECPGWQVWEYSSSLSARLDEIEYNAEQELQADFDSPEDVTSILADIAQQVRDLGEEKQESADNIESGFGHSTYQSEELAQQADDLSSWADDIEGTDIPELPDPEEVDCDECNGTGEVEDEQAETAEDANVDCTACDGTGQVTPEEPTDAQMDEWREGARSAAADVLGNCPV